MRDALGGLERDVVAVIRETCNLRDGRRARQLRAVIVAADIFKRDVLHCLLAAHHLGSRHNGVDKGLVPRAAANIPVLLEPCAHLGARGILIDLQKSVRGDDEAGRAKSALRSAERDPRLLERMHVLRRADALNCDDLGVLFDGLHLPCAGADDLAVKDNRAGAAYACPAAHFYTCVPRATENCREGVLLQIAEHRALDAVDP